MAGRKRGRGTARYAVWKGDGCIAIGTARELAEKLGIPQRRVYWLASPANKKRDGGNRRVTERI